MTDPSGDGHRVRPAREGDAPAIAEVHVRSWQVAYRGQLPDELLDGLTGHARTHRWERTISEGSPDLLVLVDDEDVPVGFAATAASRDQDATPATGELFALYLDPARWGQGEGGALLDAAVARLRDDGFSDATLWVLATNTRTIGFYQAQGWRPDGHDRDLQVGGTMVREHRYRRRL